MPTWEPPSWSVRAMSTEGSSLTAEPNLPGRVAAAHRKGDGLEVDGLTAGYGGLPAVRGLSFDCNRGEVLTLIGPNGAGKTTVLHAVTGLLRPMAGRVFLDGKLLTGLPVHRAARLGIALVPSEGAVFPHLGVHEHIRLALRSPGRKGRATGAATVDQVMALFPGLARRRGAGAGDLSGGERQMLAIAGAMLMNPWALLIDELSLGLAPKIVSELMPMIRRMADHQGVAVVLVEQHYELALEIADTCVVLSHGEIVYGGEAASLRGQREKVEQMYLGGTDARKPPQLPSR